MRLMEEHRADLGDYLIKDERGKRLLDYLGKLVALHTAERTALFEELESLKKGVDHIRDIITTQQSYARAPTSVLEPVMIGALLEDALRMNAGFLARRHVTVVKHWPNLPRVLLDKHLVLQIVVNLIANALQAMEPVKDRPHRLTVRAERATAPEGPGAAILRIEVEDNGEGITDENRARLFTHGFTTRKNGHGFGLHSCALAAQAMGGAIRAHSDGPGNGARFTLELPFREVPARPA
jgi:signal transduction histidine kinase